MSPMHGTGSKLPVAQARRHYAVLWLPCQAIRLSPVGWVTVLNRQLSGLKTLAEGVGDLLYPGACAACEAFCDASGPLCDDCARQLHEQERAPACHRCAMPVAVEGAPCPWCVGKGRYPYRRILRLGVFQEPLRKLIHQMKYNRRWPLAEILARRLLDRPEVREVLAEAERIVAVPLHWRRHFHRGYNQAEVIARQLARNSHARVVSAVQRIRDTESQTIHPSRAARAENVRGAFELTRAKAIAGRRVVVVDDVMTSGATLIEVGRALKAARPARLDALVLAIADARGFGAV